MIPFWEKNLGNFGTFGELYLLSCQLFVYILSAVCLQFQVVMTEQEVGVGEDTAIYDITLTDIDNSSLGNTLQ